MARAVAAPLLLLFLVAGGSMGDVRPAEGKRGGKVPGYLLQPTSPASGCGTQLPRAQPPVESRSRCLRPCSACLWARRRLRRLPATLWSPRSVQEARACRRMAAPHGLEIKR